MKTTRFVGSVCLVSVAFGGTISTFASVRAASSPHPVSPSIRQQEWGDFGELLTRVNRSRQLNLIADAHIGEQFPLESYEKWEADPDKFVARLARQTRRDVVRVGDIYVLRHKQWKALSDADAQQENHWESNGVLTITATASTAAVPGLTTVNVSARSTPIAVLARELTAKTALSLEVPKEIGQRRLNAQVQNVDPVTLVHAIAFLVNAGPRIALTPTEEQKAAEKYAGYPPTIQQRMRASDALRGDLEKLLTPEQKQANDQGEFVALPVGKMPEDLRKRALDYINTARSSILNLDPSGDMPFPDLRRQQAFQIRFRPRQSGELWYQLGAVMIADDGTEYYF